MANMNMESVNMFPRSIVFGNIRNMSSVNTLIRKVYLLAGVIMAANMFIVNEVKASEDENENADTKGSDNEDKNKESFFDRVLHVISAFIIYRDDTTNFIGGLALSGANNYFKWWDYNAGRYWKLGCYGWRTKRFFNDYLQFDININLGRGIFRLISGTLCCLKPMLGEESPRGYPFTATIIMCEIKQHRKKQDYKYDKKDWASFFFILVLQGFISAPLTVHFSNLSISISLDSIFWRLIGKILSPVD